MKKSIKVLVIDDSALVRQTLSDIINSDDQLEVIGVAADPFFAAQKIKYTRGCREVSAGSFVSSIGWFKL